MQKQLAGALLTVLALLAAPAAAQATTVTNTHDHGPGSLRAAFEAATDGTTINVPKGHYELTSGALTTTAIVDIAGAGARKTIIDANHHSRVMIFDNAPGIVHISGLTVREGNGDDGGDGGGIDSDKDLILARVAIVHNIAGTTSNLSNGGGLFAPNIVIHRSLFAYNQGYNGGALAGDQIMAVDSTFAFNKGGSVQIGENGDGGAFDDPVTLIDSTVAFNDCFNFPTCGAAMNNSATLRGTLITGNRAYADNGLPLNSAGNVGVPNNCDSTIVSEGHNLDSIGDCALTGTGDVSGRAARLSSKLKNLGGQTNSLAIGKRSPAFNAGATTCTARDQRFVRRPQGRRCDIGAFELHL